jgi:hypothetical protein
LHLNRCFIGRFILDGDKKRMRTDKQPSTSDEECKASSHAEPTSPVVNTSSAAATAACFALLAASPKLSRLSHALSDAGGPSVGFLPPLAACATLTSLTITNWAKVSTPDLEALHSLAHLRHLEFYLAEFREQQMWLLLPPFSKVASDALVSSTPPPRRLHSSIQYLMLVGCGVLTPSEELVRLSLGFTPPPRDSSRHNSATPHLTCAPLYAWSGLASFLEDCFQVGMSVKHKRYY